MYACVKGVAFLYIDMVVALLFFEVRLLQVCIHVYGTE